MLWALTPEWCLYLLEKLGTVPTLPIHTGEHSCWYISPFCLSQSFRHLAHVLVCWFAWVQVCVIYNFILARYRPLHFINAENIEFHSWHFLDGIVYLTSLKHSSYIPSSNSYVCPNSQTSALAVGLQELDYLSRQSFGHSQSSNH